MLGTDEGVTFLTVHEAVRSTLWFHPSRKASRALSTVSDQVLEDERKKVLVCPPLLNVYSILTSSGLL